jgi:glutamate-5-semialdehyde dehydrogenase
MSQTIHEMIRSKAQSAKAAMRKLSSTSVDVRNGALLAMADSILTFKDKIQEANQMDLEEGQKNGTRRTAYAATGIG